MAEEREFVCVATGTVSERGLTSSQFTSTYRPGLRELLPCNERMLSRLLRCPSLHRVQVQQSLTEIDERRAAVQF